MIRHSQQIISDPERGDGHDSNGRPGDCWKACIASLLDLPIESVPHFAELGDTWWEATQAFIQTQKADHELRWWEDIAAVNEGSEFLIASGPSPRGDFQHAVIVDRSGGLVHDPHPSRAGLAGGPSTFFGIRARAAAIESVATPEWGVRYKGRVYEYPTHEEALTQLGHAQADVPAELVTKGADGEWVEVTP